MTIREDLLVWIDLEMTGLDPERCTIVEIASIVTDSNLELVAEGPDLVVHATEEALGAMAPIVQRMHTESGLIDEIRASRMDVRAAEDATLEFLKQHTAARTAPLCGNSIWKDRQFIERYMPRLAEHLHYRLIDVSTLKELARRWRPEASPPPRKKESHRALADIRESIAELAHYRSSFLSPKS
jgi:oligoribonuclease